MPKAVILGGAGFIGANAARSLAARGWSVVVFDNFSRPGSGKNRSWLETGGGVEFVKGDLRRMEDLRPLFSRHGGADLLLHLAAQVAVTTSVADPRDDFENNALGTFNVLEAAREARFRGPMIYASTNKVYGALEEFRAAEEATRHLLPDFPDGVGEDAPLDFHSPYGCSKGAADQYWRDYARIFGLKTVVFRQSCIYGPRQFGVEDQGWVAWFCIATALGRPLTVYGDGKQVRDLLYVDDLVEAYLLAAGGIGATAGRAYNIGGGPGQTLSLLEFLDLLSRLAGRRIEAGRAGWRPGDQKVFVADVRRAARDFGWRPRIGVEDGVRRLWEWVQENRNLFGE